MRLFHAVSAAAFAAALGALWLAPQPPPDPPAPPPPALPLKAETLPPPYAPAYPLAIRLRAAELEMGDAVFVRIFKAERVLEVWIRDGARFRLFESYPICAFSGALGPKLKEGDFQSPEGFYEVGRRQLNPNSAYHLAFNLGFPNAYDRAHGRTGSHLMVHGDCASVGCYAMTDAGIDEIYGLVAAALGKGQRSVPVHIFPFRMDGAAMRAHAGGPWDDYWANLKEGHDAFEAEGVPPQVFVCEDRYAFSAGPQPHGCSAVRAW